MAGNIPRHMFSIILKFHIYILSTYLKPSHPMTVDPQTYRGEREVMNKINIENAANTINSLIENCENEITLDELDKFGSNDMPLTQETYGDDVQPCGICDAGPDAVMYGATADEVFSSTTNMGRLSWKKALTDPEELKKIQEMLAKHPFGVEGIFRGLTKMAESETFAMYADELHMQICNVASLF